MLILLILVVTHVLFVRHPRVGITANRRINRYLQYLLERRDWVKRITLPPPSSPPKKMRSMAMFNVVFFFLILILFFFLAYENPASHMNGAISLTREANRDSRDLLRHSLVHHTIFASRDRITEKVRVTAQQDTQFC